MRYWLIGFLGLASASLFAQTDTDQKVHSYAFDRPEILATQRVFGIGNAVMMLGEVCADDGAAHASYVQWLVVNGETFKQMMARLADYYQISTQSENLQQRLADSMHLKTRLSLSGSEKSDACDSLPETLALPSMDLAKRYQAILVEVKNPDYLKQKRTFVPAAPQAPVPDESIDEPEEQTGTE